MSRKLAGLTGAVGLAAVGALAATVLLVGGAGASHADSTCAPAPPAAGSGTAVASPAAAPIAGGAGLPARIGAYDGQQVANAAQVMLAGRDVGADVRGQTVGVMTAIGESGLIAIDHGDSVGPDSRGIFQQRGNGAWGSYADRMNPRSAAQNFLKALLAVPGWESMPPTLAAHAVQRNADPYYYEPFWDDAVLLVGTLAGDPNLAAQLPASAALPCAPAAAGTFTGPGGAFPAQACSVIPDPSTDTGCLTPRMDALYLQLVAQGWHPGCFRPGDPVPGSDHPLGRACDAPPGAYGHMPDAAQKAKGDALAASLIATAGQTGVHYLIWYGQIWNIQRAREGWRPYTGAGVYNVAPTSPGGITGGHFDHVHISVF